ncbi:hypothetical protein TUM17386_12790 [Shewanella algae]|nr:hypothetical protein TUM17386_12790 [Shewanella algae]
MLSYHVEKSPSCLVMRNLRQHFYQLRQKYTAYNKWLQPTAKTVTCVAQKTGKTTTIFLRRLSQALI